MTHVTFPFRNLNSFTQHIYAGGNVYFKSYHILINLWQFDHLYTLSKKSIEIHKNDYISKNNKN